MKERLVVIDALRAISILMVVICHLTYWVNYPDYLYVPHIFFGISAQLFFLLSAFSIFYGYFERLNNMESIKKFLVRRFFWIAPGFYFMIIIWSISSMFMGYSPSFDKFLINFTMIFNFFPGAQGSIVWAGWTIGVLFIFYLLVPLLITFVRRITIALGLLVGLLFISSYYHKYMDSILGASDSFGYMSIVTQMPFFVMGILLFLVMRKFLINQKIYEKRLTKIIGFGLVVFGLFWASMLTWLSPIFLLLLQVPYIDAPFYAWGITLICITVGFILYPWKGIVNRVTKFIGDRSYSVYLIHPWVLSTIMPIYPVIYGWISDWGLAFFISLLLTLLLVLGFAILLYKFIEKPASIYGEKLLLKRVKQD